MSDKYSGMTINERLYVSGLIGNFDEAVKNKKNDVIISILKQVEIDILSIEQILKQLGLE